MIHDNGGDIVIHLVLAQVVAVLVAEPVLVAAHGPFLIQLEGGQHIGAIGGVGLQALAVVGGHLVGLFLGGDGGAILEEALAGFIQILLDQEIAQLIGHIEGRLIDGLFQDEVDGVIVDLLEAHVVPADHGAHVLDLQILVGVAVVGSARGQVVFIDVLGGNPGFVSVFVFHGGVAVHGVIRDGHILGSNVALSVGSAGDAPEVHIQEHFGTGGDQILGGLGDGVVGLFAGVQIVLGVDDGEVAVIPAVGAAVQHLGVQLLLHGIHEVVGIDGGAVVPGDILTQGDTPGLGFLAFLDAVLAGVLSGHVHGILGGHFGHDGVAGLVAVQLEGIEGADLHAADGVVIRGFPGQGVPVGLRGQTADVIIIGINLFIGVVLALDTGVHVAGHAVGAAASRGNQSDDAAVKGALAGIIGRGRREGLGQRGHGGKHHDQGQHDRENLFHSVFLLFISVLDPNGYNGELFYHITCMYVKKSTVEYAKKQNLCRWLANEMQESIRQNSKRH